MVGEAAEIGPGGGGGEEGEKVREGEGRFGFFFLFFFSFPSLTTFGVPALRTGQEGSLRPVASASLAFIVQKWELRRPNGVDASWTLRIP
jgi:hypothetical protein